MEGEICFPSVNSAEARKLYKAVIMTLAMEPSVSLCKLLMSAENLLGLVAILTRTIMVVI